jgi:hypothetical protein
MSKEIRIRVVNHDGNDDVQMWVSADSTAGAFKRRLAAFYKSPPGIINLVLQVGLERYVLARTHRLKVRSTANSTIDGSCQHPSFQPHREDYCTSAIRMSGNTSRMFKTQPSSPWTCILTMGRGDEVRNHRGIWRGRETNNREGDIDRQKEIYVHICTITPIRIPPLLSPSSPYSLHICPILLSILIPNLIHIITTVALAMPDPTP